MQDGDLALWMQSRVVVVLEGALAEVPQRKRLLFKPLPPPPASNWKWNRLMIKHINYRAKQFNQLFDVVTFLGDEVAALAADYLESHHVRVSSCVADDFDLFCESLTWRDDVEYVIDSDESRHIRYGSRGYLALRDGGLP